MEIEYARSLSFDSVRALYKSHLQSLELGRNTVTTVLADTFYLWKNEGQDVFWNAITAENFAVVAREELEKALRKNSVGNVEKLINGYLYHLRRFRDFILENNISYSEKDDATAVKDFLLDIECLDPLDEWTSKFNLFDILKISRVEIRHSNMLSWLLNPNENHGLGDSVLRGFIQYVVTSFSDSDVFETLLMDCHDFIIQREWHNIDVLAVSAKEKFVLCIENKIDSGEHSNQLYRYRRQIEESFPDYKKMFIFLSPEGVEPSDTVNWCSMSYENVLTIIENAKKKVKMLPDVQLLVDNYLDIIRRDIVGDEKLARICAEIYAKHQKALDLIFENKPDRASELADIIHAWAEESAAKGLIEYDADKSGKILTRFKTKTMSEILPDAIEAKSGWGTSNFYYYEIKNIDGKELFIQFALSSKNIPDDLRATCERINAVYRAKQQKINWQWRTHFATRHVKIDDDMTDEEIFEQLDKRLEEVKMFEKKLVEKLSER
ncbi:MAG: PD-(D/E)XK nuclease family protein [Clostridia bacterium]|nr:PD-(D/E)XK nuclease family protein [Clostridia bacterium]